MQTSMEAFDARSAGRPDERAETAPPSSRYLQAHWLPPWSLLEFVRTPDRFFLGQKARRGDTYLMKTGLGPMYVTSDPEVVKAVFTAGPERVEQPSADLFGDLIGEHSVLVATGETHKRLRQLLVPAFMGERMRALESRMQQAALERICAWTSNTVIDVGPHMEQIALDVILSVVLGMKGSRHEAMRTNIKQTLGLVNAELMFLKPTRLELGGLTRFGKLQKGRRESRALIAEEIADRRRHGVDHGTVLDSMLQARDEFGCPMRDDEIYDQVITLLVAGHETTATGLTWAFHHLLSEPHLLAEAREEVRSYRNARDFASSVMLENMCKESLRLTPVISEVPRLLRCSFEAGGIHFQAGHRLLVAISALHQREDIFAEPQRFDPTRFARRRYLPWEYAPFGGGVRKCLGWAFALTQMKIVLGSVLANWRVDLVDTGLPQASRRNLSVGPRGGVKVRVGAPVLNEH